MISDKLFYWVFQNRPDRIVALLADLPADAAGYQFSAPVLKEREYRLDGLFLPPIDRPDLPALILEAQMAAEPEFFWRLYAESARLLQQQGNISNWRVLVICPSRQLNFGDPAPVAEFLERRVRWLELLPADRNKAEPVPLLLQVLALLLQPENQLRQAVTELRQQSSGQAEEAEIIALIPAMLLARFTDLSTPEICAMGGITLEDFTQSVAYREIFGLGEARGRSQGRSQRRSQGYCGGQSRRQSRGQSRRRGMG